MNTDERAAPTIGSRRSTLPPLHNGDRLDQPTFHARYVLMREHTRAELIAGVVYTASPQRRKHSRSQTVLAHWLNEYELDTPGTEVLEGTSDILGADSEPEPDSCLFVVPEFGGQVWEDEEGYLNGPPELIAEISWSTESIDLHAKKADYEKASVCEYIVVACEPNACTGLCAAAIGSRKCRQTKMAF